MACLGDLEGAVLPALSISGAAGDHLHIRVQQIGPSFHGGAEDLVRGFANSVDGSIGVLTIGPNRVAFQKHLKLQPLQFDHAGDVPPDFFLQMLVRLVVAEKSNDGGRDQGDAQQTKQQNPPQAPPENKIQIERELSLRSVDCHAVAYEGAKISRQKCFTRCLRWSKRCASIRVDRS